MAALRGGNSIPTDDIRDGIVACISSSPLVSRGKQAACDTAFVTKKLLKSTGKAAWITGTSILLLLVPLIMEMDPEQQMNELEFLQFGLLGAPAQK